MADADDARSTAGAIIPQFGAQTILGVRDDPPTWITDQSQEWQDAFWDAIEGAS